MADIFISYAHYDNAFQRFGSEGWTDWFHRALDERLTQIRGCGANIWRDKQGPVNGILLIVFFAAILGWFASQVRRWWLIRKLRAKRRGAPANAEALAPVSSG
jgi:hypothetical protein